jgi:ABC-type nitrate/sulfonate/bicarbonate transport system permease component
MTRSNTTQSVVRFWRGITGCAGFLILWEALPGFGFADPYYLPPPSVIAMSLTELLGQGAFWVALGNTLVTWCLGLTVALVVGSSLGLAIGLFPTLRNITSSTIEFLRPIPSVALIPLLVLLMGTGRPATLTLVVYAALWQMLVQLAYGVQDVDPVGRGTAKVYRFSRWSIIRHLIWPTVLPFAMTGFRLAAAVALTLTITGELLIGTPGLGRLVITAQSSGDFPQMYGMIVVVGILGVLVNQVARRLERHFLAWHPSVRLEAL